MLLIWISASNMFKSFPENICWSWFIHCISRGIPSYKWPTCVQHCQVFWCCGWAKSRGMTSISLIFCSKHLYWRQIREISNFISLCGLKIINGACKIISFMLIKLWPFFHKNQTLCHTQPLKRESSFTSWAVACMTFSID